MPETACLVYMGASQKYKRKRVRRTKKRMNYEILKKTDRKRKLLQLQKYLLLIGQKENRREKP